METATTDERRAYLLRVVDYVLDLEEKWSADREDFTFTADMETAMENMVTLFLSGDDIPGELLEMYEQVKTLQPMFERFVEDKALASEAILPGPEFWAILRTIRELRAGAEPEPPVFLEPIAKLKEQEVSDRQICLIYGFTDRMGNPNYRMLEEEVAQPGRHTGSGTGWLPPIEKRRAEKREKQRQAVKWAAKLQNEKLAKCRPPTAPETWEDLFKQGVSAEQIAKMKNCSLAEVHAQATKYGATVPARYEPPGQQAVHEDEKRKERLNPRTKRGPKPEAAVAEPTRPKRPYRRRKESAAAVAVAEDEPPNFVDTEEMILRMHRQDFAPETIAQAVSDARKDWTAQDVRAVIARAENG